MARYDVYLASTLADRDTADMIVRRLRALKFKVRFHKTRTYATPKAKDLREVDDSSAVLVLWSEQTSAPGSDDRDWVPAIARQAQTRAGALVQATLDLTVPDEPFNADPCTSLVGLGPRKLTEDFLQLIDDFGDRMGRSGLRQWLELKASDAAGKAAWKAAHPDDPLSQASGKAKTAAAPTPVPAPTPEPAAIPARPDPVAAEPQVIPPRTTAVLKPPPLITPPNEHTLGRIILLSVTLVIACMLLTSALMRSNPLPAIANASLPEQCPAGQIPAYLLEQPTRPPLEPGPIIDDTEGD